jgi:hypothetical protein
MRDQAAQLLGDLAIEAARFDGLQGHGLLPIGQVVRPINIRRRHEARIGVFPYREENEQ